MGGDSEPERNQARRDIQRHLLALAIGALETRLDIIETASSVFTWSNHEELSLTLRDVNDVERLRAYIIAIVQKVGGDLIHDWEIGGASLVAAIAIHASRKLDQPAQELLREVSLTLDEDQL